MAEGKVFRSTGSWYIVKMDDGRLVNARLRGKFRLEGSGQTNPIAVGDNVTVSFEEDEEGAATMIDIHDRKNYISREAPKHQYSRHIIAANLDQAFMIATIAHPRTSSGFIDRFLLTAEAYHIPAVVVFNKQDLLSKPKDIDRQKEWVEMYRTAGYQVILTSVITGQGLEEIASLLDGKVSLLSGHSGVGKSTLINTAFPGMDLKTAIISKKHDKGTHTTTFAEMFELPTGGYLIDTPGIKEFGILDLQPQEVGHFYPEIRAVLGGCKFNNCLHQEEPGCAVKQAVMDGKLSYERYKNYDNIVENCKERPKY
ncbi:ribosome small subunit-dependent GTPase A [soil metagenome]